MGAAALRQKRPSIPVAQSERPLRSRPEPLAHPRSVRAHIISRAALAASKLCALSGTLAAARRPLGPTHAIRPTLPPSGPERERCHSRPTRALRGPRGQVSDRTAPICSWLLGRRASQPLRETRSPARDRGARPRSSGCGVGERAASVSLRTQSVALTRKLTSKRSCPAQLSPDETSEAVRCATCQMHAIVEQPEDGHCHCAGAAHASGWCFLSCKRPACRRSRRRRGRAWLWHGIVSVARAAASAGWV